MSKDIDVAINLCDEFLGEMRKEATKQEGNDTPKGNPEDLREEAKANQKNSADQNVAKAKENNSNVGDVKNNEGDDDSPSDNVGIRKFKTDEDPKTSNKVGQLNYEGNDNMAQKQARAEVLGESIVKTMVSIHKQAQAELAGAEVPPTGIAEDVATQAPVAAATDVEDGDAIAEQIAEFMVQNGLTEEDLANITEEDIMAAQGAPDGGAPDVGRDDAVAEQIAEFMVQNGLTEEDLANITDEDIIAAQGELENMSAEGVTEDELGTALSELAAESAPQPTEEDGFVDDMVKVASAYGNDAASSCLAGQLQYIQDRIEADNSGLSKEASVNNIGGVGAVLLENVTRNPRSILPEGHFKEASTKRQRIDKLKTRLSNLNVR